MGIVFDAPGKLFFGGLYCGVYRFDGVNWTLYTSLDGLGDNHMQNMGISPTGEVWACSKYAGASILSGTMMEISPTEPLNTFSVYPNPADESVTVQCDPGSTVNIVDVLGRTVMCYVAASNESIIDISALPQGIYSVNLQSENHQYSRQLVVE